MPKSPSILIIVENLTMPLDRRVWQEARTLRDNGYTVSVVCPVGGKYTAPYELLEGIHVFRHPLPYEADGPLGYAIEYTWALAWEFALSVKAYYRVGFDVVQACNPPDLLFLIAGFWKYLFGKRFIFDHHDINPELYEAKFNRRGFFHALLSKLERWTFRTADASIATNETFKEIAIKRGGMDPDRVFIVRSIPDVSRFKRVAPDMNLRKGHKHVIGYVGIMGAQDGVDLLIKAMDEMVNVQHRRDVGCVIVGSGTEVANLQAMVGARGLGDHVTFTGFLSGAPLLAALSSFDVGAIPDPKNTYNDKISMNKAFEYMTLGIPFVQFDLMEGRKIAGDAALYASDNCPVDLARQLGRLIDEPELCAKLADEGQARAKALLKWDEEAARLIGAYEAVLAPETAAQPVPQPATL
ncbi:MAG TPA: glycosyltransferase family 4 protein [Hyphomicrobiaceae bacterium]|nr:glycosyltransferase family 4 protein [Hyphomicrobiaceae bacterium]